VHRNRIRFLERITERHDNVAFWGDGASQLPADSPIRHNYRGIAWGPEMFLILRRSHITLNKHIAIAENNANNMRLFEATGMGACLITDWKENLHDLFEPGKEVIAYHSVEECLDLIRYFCEHSAERGRIAEAGHARCLRDHTYQQRMVELTAVLMRYFK
jgi:spore maturation protein CgeB